MIDTLTLYVLATLGVAMLLILPAALAVAWVRRERARWADFQRALLDQHQAYEQHQRERAQWRHEVDLLTRRQAGRTVKNIDTPNVEMVRLTRSGPVAVAAVPKKRP
jgi:hypothetical protein